MRRVLLLLMLISLVGAKPAIAARTSGKLTVKAAMVTEYGTGRVLYSQDPDKRIPPASVTKIMTMYLVFDALASGRAHLGDRVKISRRADATGGSTMNLKAGETVSLDELMQGMAVASGNDACIAIAEHFGGIPQFVSMMNHKAQELGMTGTHFVNPNGLPAPGQLTTARDLTKLATSYLRHYPQALRYHSTTAINHRGAVHGNSNHLLGAVDGVDGIKTGYVDASGYNIVATAKRGDTRIIAVVLGGRTKGIRNHETTRILNAAFSGSVDSMLAARDVDAPSQSFSRHAKAGHHHLKKARLASNDRRTKISASRGASARFDKAEPRSQGPRYKASRSAKSKTTMVGQSASRHHHRKAGASAR
ncbi:MAG: D-alanyl-D-alanine carboxypeptidase family protein [Desulfovibrionaceae bacterium]